MNTEVRLRIYITEKDKAGHTPLYRDLITFLHKKGVVGCTVLRGVAGYGKKGKDHEEALLLLGENLPLIVEIIDKRETLEPLIPELQAKAPEALITWEEVGLI